MASLVTLGAAPYNPYNTSFASIALQGLGMAQNEMNQRDQLAQASYQNYMKSVQFGADLLFKGQEMQLQKRKMDFTVDQAMFERKMAVEDQQFRREQFGEQKRQFDVGSGLEGRRVELAEKKFGFEETVYKDQEPLRDLQATNTAVQTLGNIKNLEWAIQDRPLGIRTKEIQNATALANSTVAIQNAEIGATNAETSRLNAETRAKQIEQYDKHRAAGVRAYDSLIKQKDQQIADARRERERRLVEIKGSKRTTSPAVQQVDKNIEILTEELKKLKTDKYNFETQAGGAVAPQAPLTPDEEERRRVDDYLYRRRHPGVDGSLFPNNTGDSTYD